jgi:8-oxo-dGTP diphosphatase
VTDRPLVLVAACALIDPDGRVLIAQRPQGKSMAGLWEFPGGKVEQGEKPEDTVIREMQEELGITIKEACLAPFIFASHTYPEFHLLMPLFLCRRWEGIAQPREGQKVAWVKIKDLALNTERYPMPPADAPLIPLLRDLL